jgi:predicted TIM-barrel fold metal-dependent hydrolase
VIVDSLAFLGESLYGPRASAGELLAAMDDAGIARAVVAPMRPPGYRLEPANELVAKAVRRHPDRLAGLARVDPNLGEPAAAELERALGELRLCGLFLHPWEETFRVSAWLVDPVLEVARARGVPVVVVAGYPWLSEGLQVGELARRFPDVQIVATNGGQINISGLGQTDVELALEANGNLAVQTAGVYREDFLENVVVRFGADRLLYASMFPLLEPRLELRRGQWLPVGEDVRAGILGGNAARIFGLSS